MLTYDILSPHYASLQITSKAGGGVGRGGGGGGLIRNANGEWISGYTRALRLLRMLQRNCGLGINLCLSLNLPAVEIELDAKLVVDLLSKTATSLIYCH